PQSPARFEGSPPHQLATATRSAHSPPAPVSVALERELESLDRARAALRRGAATEALAGLDRHEHTFPHGSLGVEARVLRAEALLASGDQAAARALARELLSRDPSGPHAKRLRSIANEERIPPP